MDRCMPLHVANRHAELKTATALADEIAGTQVNDVQVRC